jgi:hypothetical protein
VQGFSLYPEHLRDDIRQFERFLSTELADEVTKWMFGNMLLTGPAFGSEVVDHGRSNITNIQARDAFLRFCTRSASPRCPSIPLVEKLVLWSPLGTKVIVPTMIKSNSISAQSMHTSRDRIFAILQQLQDRQHLSSNFIFNTSHPTAADITLASFLFPVLLPVEMEYFFATREQMLAIDAPGPLELVKFADELEERFSIVRNVKNLYRQYRW